MNKLKPIETALRVCYPFGMYAPNHQPLIQLAQDVINCNRCPRLRRYCEAVSLKKRRAFQDEPYWGKPVPSLGDPDAALFIIGLAPAAHGGNRTGRVFTGDDSGNFLANALHKAGFANQPTSTRRHDGLSLKKAYITALIHCAPPKNKPQPIEITRCRPFLIQELEWLKQVKAVLVLGQLAFTGYLETIKEIKMVSIQPRPKFAHGASYDLDPTLPRLFASYHPSRQNTQTRRLTGPMFHSVFQSIIKYLDGV